MTHVTAKTSSKRLIQGIQCFFVHFGHGAFHQLTPVQCKNGKKFATVQRGARFVTPCDHDHREHWRKDLQHLQLVQHSFQFPYPDDRSFAIQKEANPALNH